MTTKTKKKASPQLHFYFWAHTSLCYVISIPGAMLLAPNDPRVVPLAIVWGVSLVAALVYDGLIKACENS